jgi:hypothetical protein
VDNPETLATLATQDEENTEGAINNGQSRDTGNIDHTKRRENRRGNQQWTIQRHWQHWPHKTKRILKGQSTLDNPETLATLTTQDEEKTEGAINNGQSRDTGNIATQDEEKQNTKNTTQKNK